jgi:hypothetical protein
MLAALAIIGNHLVPLVILMPDVMLVEVVMVMGCFLGLVLQELLVTLVQCAVGLQ